jgi:thiol-disulfide isomerase/thioredoxin
MAKLLIATTLIVALGAFVVTFARDSALPPPTTAVAGEELESLTTATAWLNSPPLTAAGLRGKVVLVQVWTFSCINWLRTLPYVRAWAAKYKDQGLVVIGVHDPEFGFEQNLDNVRRATMGMDITYPVAIDNNFTIWRAFKNNYWPALYLVDAHGRVRYHHFGEGKYAESETAIQQLLIEAVRSGIGRELVSVEGQGNEAAADWNSLESPETYVGFARGENLASPGGAVPGHAHDYSAPARLGLNQWALSGTWTMESQALTLNEANGRIAYRFHARDLHLVMGPARGGTAIRFRVFIDGQPPQAAHGLDVDAEGYGTATEQRMFQLIRQPGSIADRLFTIEFLDPGVEAFVFTFG